MEAITLLAIVLIVAFAFRSVVAPLIALAAAGVSFVVTLRLTAYFSERSGWPAPTSSNRW